MAKNDSVFGFTDDDDDYSGVLDDGKSKSSARPQAPAPAPAPSRRDMRARPESAPLPAPKPAASGALPAPQRPAPAPAPRPEQPAPRREETMPARAPQPQGLPVPQRPAPTAPAPAPTRPSLPPVRRENTPAPTPTRPEPTYVDEPAYAPEPTYSQEPAYAPEPERQYQPAPQQPQYDPRAEQPQYDPRRDQAAYAPAPQRPLYDEDDRDEPKGRGKGSKKQSKSKNKNTETRRNRVAGGRKKVLIVRYSVMCGVLLMALLGVKSIVFPPSLPSPDQVVARVQEGLGVTNFPADQGEGFVLSFADTYLNYTTETASVRNAALQNYTDITEITSGGLSFTSGTTHEVTQGPYVSGVRYTDDQNAIYTVSAQINNDAWVYLAIPVFYDPSGRSFVVSTTPSLVPAPPLAQAPIIIENQQTDDEASKSASSAVNAFMEAWASSDQDRLDVVVDADADARARHGLGSSVELGSVDKIEVFADAAEEESTGSNGAVREAKVSVTWKVPNAPVEEGQPAADGSVTPPANTDEFAATYSATYRMLLVYQGDGKWLVRDILPYGTSMEDSKPAGAATPAAGESGS